MSIGQEGDTRQYRRQRKTDYYDSKANAEAEKRQPKRFPKCKTCKQELTGINWNGFCLRCFRQ